MRKILLSAIVVASTSIAALAQDAHFTQYFASPLSLNPAQTGLTPSDWRASANFRTQWYTVSNNPYVTGSAAFDMPLLRGKLPEGDALGVGIHFLYDKAGSGGLTNLTGTFSVAYHKSFGINKQHTVSLGVQGALVQKSVNFNKLTFGDQLNPAMPEAPYATSAELANAVNTDLTYPDFNAGLMYTGRINEKSTFYGGFSYYHLTSPEEKFLTSSGSSEGLKINPRYSGYLGGSFEVNDNVVMYLSGLYQGQGPTYEVLVGGAVGFILNPMHDEYKRNTIFYLGSWYRFGDAIAPYVGFEWSKMQIGFSYDVTVSKAQPMTSGQGAYEISLIYNGLINKITRKSYNFACPKF